MKNDECLDYNVFNLLRSKRMSQDLSVDLISKFMLFPLHPTVFKTSHRITSAQSIWWINGQCSHSLFFKFVIPVKTLNNKQARVAINHENHTGRLEFQRRWKSITLYGSVFSLNVLWVHYVVRVTWTDSGLTNSFTLRSMQEKLRCSGSPPRKLTWSVKWLLQFPRLHLQILLIYFIIV